MLTTLTTMIALLPVERPKNCTSQLPESRQTPLGLQIGVHP